MSHFAMLIPSSISLSRTHVSSLSVPFLLIALFLVICSPRVSAQYLSVIEIGNGIVDNSRVAGPRWQRVSFKPIVSGAHAIRLSWDGNAEIQFSIFRKHDAPPPNDRRRIATSSGGSNLQVWTGILNQSEQYYLGVWAASGSANFTATIQAETIAGDPIQMVTQPTDLSVNAGEDAYFSVKATGGDVLSYQWFANNARINGANSNTLKISSPPVSVSGTNYTATISDENGSITSEAATLTVNKVHTPLAVTEQPADLTLTEGADAIFSVTAKGSGMLSYQWFADTTPINGATSNTLTISSATLIDASTAYSVVVSDENGSITSEYATLTVKKVLVTLALTMQPADLEITEGQDAIFTVTATGGDSLSYQWFADNTAINGATSRTLMISSPPLSVSGTAFSVVISDDSGSITSEIARLTINELRMTVGLTEQPTDLKITEGQDAIFTVAANGSGKLSYQWFARTTAILDDNTFVINPTTKIPDATGDTLVISSVSLADSLSGYSVEITDDNGSVTSDVAILTVDEALVSVSIIRQPDQRIVTADEIALVRSGNTPPESQ